MYYKILIIFITTLIWSYESFCQTFEKKMYENAYKYIKSSEYTQSYAKSMIYSTNYCKTITDKDTITDNLDLKNLNICIGDKLIKSTIWSCFCDFLKRGYNIDKKCNELLSTNDVPLVSSINDSLVSLKYDILIDSTDLEVLRNFFSSEEKGLILFFSLPMKRHLSAELRYFCSSFKENLFNFNYSQTFYFIFDENGNIDQVYFGRVER